jgi:hypothetical protein
VSGHLRLITGGEPPPEVPPSYEEWLETEAGVKLEPGQRELVRVGLDGRRPRAVDPAWRSPVLGESARIFHFDMPPPEGAMKTLCAVLGIRSGKSRLLGALHAVYQADTCPLRPDQIAPGEDVYCSFIGPVQKKGIETMAYALGMIRENPRLRARIIGHVPEHNKAESFSFRSKYGATIQFGAFAAGSGNINARGRYHLDSVLEEYGLFKSGEFAVNDKDVYDGVKTRLWLASGWRYGRLQVIGSPWAEEGHLFELCSANLRTPLSCVVAQASTDVLRTDPNVLAMMAQMSDEYRRSGQWDVFLREYGAKFLPLGSVKIYDEATLKQCPASVRGQLRPGDVVVVGVDLGLVHDHAAIVVVRVREEPVLTARPDADGRLPTRRHYAVVDELEVPPEDGKPLQPSVVCCAFVEVMKKYGASYAMADQYYRESVREAIDGATDANGKPLSITLVNSPKDEIEAHMTARLLMGEGRVSMLPDAPALDHQLGLVKRKPVGARKWALDIPRSKTSGHCDLAEAAARALCQAYGVVVPPPPPNGWQEIAEAKADEWEKRRAEELRRKGAR